jgi:DNA-binding transcriptional MerR regulator
LARYKIHQVAEQLSTSTSTIKRLERSGRLPPPARTVSGHRVYSDRDVKQLEDILYPRRGDA